MPQGRWDGPGLEAWSGAWTPQEVARRLAGIEVPWCVVGGWAVNIVNRTNPHVGGTRDGEAILVQVKKLCQSEPATRKTDAVATTYATFKRPRKQT